MDIRNIDIDKLVLDAKNPRFAELYNGSTKERDLVEYLLYTESGDMIARAISATRQFYPDRALWVVADGDKYLVRDGNRRCAAAKALRTPEAYGLNLPAFDLKQLPVIVYSDKSDLERRIREEHTASLFKEWDRIAKALEVYRLHKAGSSVASLEEMDSKPADLIKLTSFYYAAAKVAGDDFKKLLRRGRREGGKTTIFERLFPYRELCGYTFQPKPSYEIRIENHPVFIAYVSSLVAYLQQNPWITHKEVDTQRDKFLDELEPYGFTKRAKKVRIKTEKLGSDSEQENGTKRGSTKRWPKLDRRQLPPTLKQLILECYKLNPDLFSNAKLALTRIAFECALKFVIEETKVNGKKLSESDSFKNIIGVGDRYTDFKKLKNKFTELIKNVGMRKACQNFDLEKPHQIIHNYNVGGVPADAISMCNNLMPLLEFILQDEVDLLNSLDLSRL